MCLLRESSKSGLKKTCSDIEPERQLSVSIAGREAYEEHVGFVAECQQVVVRGGAANHQTGAGFQPFCVISRLKSRCEESFFQGDNPVAREEYDRLSQAVLALTQ